MALLKAAFGALVLCCRRAQSCCRGIPPLVCGIGLFVVSLVVALVFVIDLALAKLFTVPGAFLINVVISWFILRLVVRTLVFPGSMVLWRRNTEASYRVEMAKQFAQPMSHLHIFLLTATRQRVGQGQTPSIEGVLLGFTVLEGLARNFRVQERDQVKFTPEQARVRLLVQSIEGWLSEAKVCEKGSGTHIQLQEWMQSMSRNSSISGDINKALARAELEETSAAALCIEELEQLIRIFDGLQGPAENCLKNVRRFLREPTLGSLHHLRAELLVRYSGRHFWVRQGSCKIDCMVVSCKSAGQGKGVSDEDSNDKAHLLEGVQDAGDIDDSTLFSEPFIVWCNPNAGYYETMVYESHWLDFYLSQGCNVFLFNYSGFGRSTGSSTPAALAGDVDAIVEFLKGRGVTQIGVHGRSIGGIAACHLAQRQDLKVLIADRTFSTLANTAKLTFGNWAVKGLSLSATWADNASKYLEGRCYKVMICDPKDMAIPDLSSLRTAVAMATLQRVPPSARLQLENDGLLRIYKAWRFLEVLVSICNTESVVSAADEFQSSFADKRRARQPAIGNPSVELEVRMDAGEDDSQRLVTPSTGSEIPEGPIDSQWLQDNPQFARSLLTTQCVHLTVHDLLDLVGIHLNAGGMTMKDALCRSCDDPAYVLRCFLANLQVWGSLGILPDGLRNVQNADIEVFLRGCESRHERVDFAMSQLMAHRVTPERLAVYQRQCARVLVAHICQEFSQKAAPLYAALEATGAEDASPNSRLSLVVLSHVKELESLLTSLRSFFQQVDREPGSPGNMETELRQPLPSFDRAVSGYLVTVDCGHNGVLSEGELHHLSLHLKTAQFGRYSQVSGTEP